MIEFTANCKTKGGTETVTVKAHDKDAATRKLMRLGYLAINWIL